MTRISILLVEDHFLPRMALNSILSARTDMEISAMAENGAGATCPHRRQPAALERQQRQWHDRVDTTVNPVQTSGSRPVGDGRTRHPERDEVREVDDRVLSRGLLSDCQSQWGI